MKPKNMIPPLVAVLGGGVGYALRKWNLSAGFEAETGLPIPGAPSATLLFLWSVLVAVGILALVWKYGSLDINLDALRGGEGNTVYLVVILVAGMFLLVSAGLDVLALSGNRQATAGNSSLSGFAFAIPSLLRIALCAGGLVCAGAWGRAVYRGSKGRRESLSLLELCFCLCWWLISTYQNWAGDPVIQDYAYTVVAICAALMGLYYLAGLSFGESRPRRGLFFGLLGVYLCLVALADRHTLSDMFRYGFAILFLTAHAVLLLNPVVGKRIKTESDIDG